MGCRGIAGRRSTGAASAPVDPTRRSPGSNQRLPSDLTAEHALVSGVGRSAPIQVDVDDLEIEQIDQGVDRRFRFRGRHREIVPRTVASEFRRCCRAARRRRYRRRSQRLVARNAARASWLDVLSSRNATPSAVPPRRNGRSRACRPCNSRRVCTCWASCRPGLAHHGRRVPLLRRDPTTSADHSTRFLPHVRPQAATTDLLTQRDLEPMQRCTANCRMLRDDIAPAWLQPAVPRGDSAAIHPSSASGHLRPLCRGSVAEYLDRFDFDPSCWSRCTS